MEVFQIYAFIGKIQMISIIRSVCISILFFSGLLTGCASIVSGTTQPISVSTPGCEGASCELINDKGKWYVSNTPGSVTINRAYSDLLVKCSKDDLTPSTTSVKSTTKAMAFGNILVGGIIGAGVDMANGAAYEYPSEVFVPMACQKVRATAVSSVENVQTLSGEGKSSNSRGISLGVTVSSVNRDVAIASGLQSGQGVLITSVKNDGNAASANIKVGDIIVALNDYDIPNPSVLKEKLVELNTVQPTKIKIFRERQFFDIVFKFKDPSEM
ncbi:PDZ domain-containing protein [Hydrogenophaga taeniospiralis]|uniref:PDZ domain-containing protein n=1 Tax=Hydrogenophaga taeniospiralis TaxID=65656 RepID=UPI001CF9C1C7|nr:PDZ domain-containing protein [Hydrogenophaga taeniospiralis]UCU92311.1 PDZ domain-containing protein [Hydrogenophaga taeniospiralis]